MGQRMVSRRILKLSSPKDILTMLRDLISGNTELRKSGNIRINLDKSIVDCIGLTILKQVV